MTTKNQVYDHPAYQAVLPMSGPAITGAAALGTKFTAFTNQIIKSITIAATVLSTAADIWSIVKVTGVGGTNTTTTTQVYGTHGSAAYFSNQTPAGTAGTATNQQVQLQQGDTWWVQKGADTAGTYSWQVELVVLPLSNFTV